MNEIAIVGLTLEERAKLLELLGEEETTITKLIWAHTLLSLDEGYTNVQIAEALNISPYNVERMLRRFIESGLSCIC